jgi:mannose-6-phosphate isomerase-like protein (cupin superfamily)
MALLDMDICSFALLMRVVNLDALQQELNSLPENAWQPHVNKRYYHGSWDVLPLRCALSHQDAHPILQSFMIQESPHWHDLPQLKACPSILALIASLACPVKSVRLMRLHPNSHIMPHRDKGLCAERGEARLHLPIQTHHKLRFLVNDETVPMEAGELWYINADQTHSVENNGSQACINLVIDCEANTWLKELIYARSMAKDSVTKNEVSPCLNGITDGC